jgi:hypothetical protein
MTAAESAPSESLMRVPQPQIAAALLARFRRLAGLAGLALAASTTRAQAQEGGRLQLIAVTPVSGSLVDSSTIVKARLAYRIDGFDSTKYLYTIQIHALNTQGSVTQLTGLQNLTILNDGSGEVVIATAMSELWHAEWIARPFQLTYSLWKVPAEGMPTGVYQSLSGIPAVRFVPRTP